MAGINSYAKAEKLNGRKVKIISARSTVSELKRIDLEVTWLVALCTSVERSRASFRRTLEYLADCQVPGLPTVYAHRDYVRCEDPQQLLAVALSDAAPAVFNTSQLAKKALEHFGLEMSCPEELCRFKVNTVGRAQLRRKNVTILRDLIARQPGQDGKWFAAAKDAGFLELAVELANRSPSDPRTLIRAARDFAVERPELSLAAGMTGLHGIANGYGYDIAGVDVLDAYAAVMQAAGAAGVGDDMVKADVRAIITASRDGGTFIEQIMAHALPV